MFTSDADVARYLPIFCNHLAEGKRQPSELLRATLRARKLNNVQRLILLKAAATCGGLAMHSERGAG